MGRGKIGGWFSGSVPTVIDGAGKAGFGPKLVFLRSVQVHLGFFSVQGVPLGRRGPVRETVTGDPDEQYRRKSRRIG